MVKGCARIEARQRRAPMRRKAGITVKMLQLDVNRISFRPLEPEIMVYEPAAREDVVVENALVLLLAVEKGDDAGTTKQAADDALVFAERQGIGSIVIYPFAHLSQQLDEPSHAIELIREFASIVRLRGFNTIVSPFGWNKKLSLDIKGYPLAEQMRSYGTTSHPGHTHHRRIDTSIVGKSEFSALPESDHRAIGMRLDLFSFQEVSPGMVYWHPNGHTIYRELVAFARELSSRNGYKEVSNPALANIALWHASGHMEKYLANMFVFEVGGERLGMKPMNCPSTMLIYKASARSYRDLPLRLSVFDKVYRNEVSGSLTGLFRVREMTQDDAHIFLMEEQVEHEITSLLAMMASAFATFGLDYSAKLSTMPELHLGSEELWDRATAKLRRALEANNLAYTIDEKSGAFYGPKIDIEVLDSSGRAWQCGTIQLDYQLPARLELRYTSEDGSQQTPVVVHRAIMGSIERFIGILIGHYGGKFPLWLAPVQLKVLSIAKAQNDYAERVHRRLVEGGIRAELDISDRTLDYKIRYAQMHHIPYIAIAGRREAEAGTLALRTRDNKQKGGMSIEEVEQLIKGLVRSRSGELGL